MSTMLQLPPVLTDEILIRCHERAPRYDRENVFFSEDFQDLRDAGYLLLPVPEEFGGRGRKSFVGCALRGRSAPLG